VGDSHQIRIVLQPGGTGQIYLDGEQINNVQSITVKGESGELSLVTLELIANNVEVEVDGVQDVTPLDAKGGFRVFRNSKTRKDIDWTEQEIHSNDCGPGR